MLTIILDADADCNRKALENGFQHKVVLVKESGAQSTDANRAQLERETRNLHPFRFLVADTWGMGPD